MRARSLIVVMLLAGKSGAQPADNKGEADRLFNEGLALSNKGAFGDAREKFAASYAKFPSPNALLNMARMEHLTGRCLDAVNHYESYRELPDNPRITPSDREEARKYEGECLAKIGRIAVHAPPTASVKVDRQPIPWRAGEAIHVEPGEHDVEVSSGAKVVSRHVTCKAGDVVDVEIEERATPPPATKMESVAWPPPATAWIFAGVGALATGVGVGFAADGASQTSRLNGMPPGVCADLTSPACMERRNVVDAQNRDWAAGASFLIAGGVCLAAAAVTWIVWPSQRAVAAKMSGFSIRF